MKSQVRTNLSKVCTILWLQCHIMMQNKLKQYQDYKKKKMDGNAAEMYCLITKISNVSGVMENSICTILESVYNVLFIQDDYFNNLMQYYEDFIHCINVAELTGWLFSTQMLRDLCIAEYKA